MVGRAISLLVLALTACATQPQAPTVITETKVVDTACQWARPIFISKQDVLTDETARSILAHNLAGANACGWKSNQ